MNKHTERSYRTGQALFRQWAETEPADATRQQLEQYVQWMKETGKSAKTIRTRLAAISAIHHDKSIAAGLVLPPVLNSIDSYKAYPAMEPEEFHRIEGLIPSDDIETRLMWYTMGYEGLRVGDMIELTWDKFKWPWMDVVTREYCEAWKLPAILRGDGSRSNVFTIKTRSAVIKRLSKYWPEAHRLHMLRKHAAKRWIAMGLDSLEVARRLGHKIDNELVLTYTGGWQ